MRTRLFYRAAVSPRRKTLSNGVASALEQRERCARQLALRIGVVEHHVEMMALGNEHWSVRVARSVAWPRLPEQVRLTHEFGGLVRACGDQEGRIGAGLQMHGREPARFRLVETKVGVE